MRVVHVWEIYDEVDSRTARRSRDRFRTSAQAWEAGMAVLNSEVILADELRLPE